MAHQAAAERIASATLTGLVGALVFVAVGAALTGVRILRAPEEDADNEVTCPVTPARLHSPGGRVGPVVVVVVLDRVSASGTLRAP